MSKGSDTYSIRQVIDLTGLSEFTLRGWETRYNAFKPRRSPTGRRSYSGADLQKALLLRELIQRNFRIGNIAELSNRDLENLLEKKAEDLKQPAGMFQHVIGKILTALSLQEWDEVETKMDKAIRTKKPNVVLTNLIIPLVKELGGLVASNMISISQEHIFSSLIKERLYLLRNTATKCRKKARFIVASPEGDFHELGILIAHTMLAHAGFQSVYLGPNTPKKDLCETALRFEATHVLVGSTVTRREGAHEDLYSFVHFLDRHLRQDVAIWVGGRNAVTLPSEMNRDLATFTSLTDFEKALKSLV
jgi:methanogenic corrinoid protein MtbC1